MTSSISVIRNPTAFSARTADSRPGPGPFTRTSRLLTPYSLACVAGLLGGHLSRERRALARAFEAAVAGRRPRERVSLPIRDADDRVVEGRMNVRHGVENLPFGFLANLSCCCRGCGGGRCSCHLLSLLEFLDAATRAFARARIGPRALAAQRQAAAMPNASVATEIHQSLDVHRDFTAQIALDGELRDDLAQARDLGLREVLDLPWSASTPAALQVMSARLRPMPKMCVSAIPTCLLVGMLTPAIRAIVLFLLALALLVPRVFANHAHHAAAAHDLALPTNLAN